ncbi:hypothetical protein AAT19DRAFT_15728 [Rhodotorula toruloides]|uniref:Uncharacterized protein n=1 Tax=Rhodotorula toruloides TaxID=5286 RepID=A0A2T0A4P1_RHOTO|nr:hypothetical protein AAT19DRAFT_15728 [Rhodotorula toruloides]
MPALRNSANPLASVSPTATSNPRSLSSPPSLRKTRRSKCPARRSVQPSPEVSRTRRTTLMRQSRRDCGAPWRRWLRADRCRKTSSAWSGRRRSCCGKSWRRRKRSGIERGLSRLSGIGRRANGRLNSFRRSRDGRRRASLQRRPRPLLRHLHLSVASSSVSVHRLQRQHQQRATAAILRRRSRSGCRGSARSSSAW